MDVITLSAAKKYVEETALGGGAIAGKNVTISSIRPITGGNRITFSYTLDDGTVKTSSLDVINGTTPVKGTDYWTDTDVSEIKSYCQNYIDTQILGGES